MVKNLKEFRDSSSEYEYLESELAKKSGNKKINDAYQTNDLTIIKRGEVWYTERCPKGLGSVVKAEMKKYYPDLKYLYGESAKLNESNSTLRKSLSMAVTCLEDIVDEIFTLNARDYTRLIDAIETCNEIIKKLETGKPFSESLVKEYKEYAVRQNQNKLTELMDEGVLDARDVADCALSWMSDDDVGEMARQNDLFYEYSLDESISVDSSVLSIEKVAGELASWAADTTDEDYTESREDYVAKCYRSYLRDLKDKQFVNGVIDLLSTRIKNTSKVNTKAEADDLEDDIELLDMVKTWKRVNFSK